MTTFWGMNVFVLPDEALEGLATEDGEQANVLVMRNEEHLKMLDAWEKLQSGELKLIDLDVDIEECWRAEL